MMFPLARIKHSLPIKTLSIEVYIRSSGVGYGSMAQATQPKTLQPRRWEVFDVPTCTLNIDTA
eukprot:4894796-Amphidinium_carterae.1